MADNGACLSGTGLSQQAVEPVPVSPVPASIPSASDILEALRQRGACDHIQAEELAFTGRNRRIDFWTLHVHPSKGHEATAYEIKVSRADFKRDTPIKQREARLFSDRFYYVAPKGLLKPSEMPEWAGLMEYDAGRLTIKLPAPMRDKDAPSWELIVSLIRNSTAIRRDEDPRLQHYRYLVSRNKQLEGENAALRKQAWSAQGIAARNDETRSGSAEGKSPVPNGDAPDA